MSHSQRGEREVRISSTPFTGLSKIGREMSPEARREVFLPVVAILATVGAIKAADAKLWFLMVVCAAVELCATWRYLES